jgi:hypothetical protein
MLTITDKAMILDDELRQLGLPLPVPVAKLGVTGIRRRVAEILAEKGDRYGKSEYRRAVRQAIREAIEGDARVDRVSAMVSGLVAKDARRRVLAAAVDTDDVSKLEPNERASLVDAKAKALLKERWIFEPSEAQYLAAADEVERDLLGVVS